MRVSIIWTGSIWVMSHLQGNTEHSLSLWTSLSRHSWLQKGKLQEGQEMKESLLIRARQVRQRGLVF